MNRNLVHPLVEKQMRVIENVQIDELPKGMRKQMKEIAKHCNACQMKQARPRRFLFSIRDRIVGEFDHVIQVDVVNLIDGSVLHSIDVGKGFQNGFLSNKMDSITAWKMLRRCWIDAYAGAPDYIHADAGNNFNSDYFKSKGEEMGSVVKIAPAAGHERIGIVERSHAYLRKLYEKLRIDKARMPREDRLSMSFRAINDVPSSNTGISPTTLFFGVYPKLPGGGHRGYMDKRVQIIRQYSELVIKMKARKMVRDSARLRNTTSMKEMEKIKRLRPGNPVYVEREKRRWTKYTLVRVMGNIVDVISPSGKISTLSINVVPPYYEHQQQANQEKEKSVNEMKTNPCFKKSDEFHMVRRFRARQITSRDMSKVFAGFSCDK